MKNLLKQKEAVRSQKLFCQQKVDQMVADSCFLDNSFSGSSKRRKAKNYDKYF